MLGRYEARAHEIMEKIAENPVLLRSGLDGLTASSFPLRATNKALPSYTPIKAVHHCLYGLSGTLMSHISRPDLCLEVAQRSSLCEPGIDILSISDPSIDILALPAAFDKVSALFTTAVLWQGKSWFITAVEEVGFLFDGTGYAIRTIGGRGLIWLVHNNTACDKTTDRQMFARHCAFNF